MHRSARFIIGILAAGRRGNIRRIAVCLLPCDVKIDRRALVDHLSGSHILGDDQTAVVRIGIRDRPDIAGLKPESTQRIARFLLCHAQKIGHLYFAGHVGAGAHFDGHISAAFRLHIPFGILADDQAALDLFAAGLCDIDVKPCLCQKIDRLILGKPHDGRDLIAAVAAYCEDDRASYRNLCSFLYAAAHDNAHRILVGFLISQFRDQSLLDESGPCRRGVQPHYIGHDHHLFTLRDGIIFLCAARQDSRSAPDDQKDDHTDNGNGQHCQDGGDPVH